MDSSNEGDQEGEKNISGKKSDIESDSNSESEREVLKPSKITKKSNKKNHNFFGKYIYNLIR